MKTVIDAVNYFEAEFPSPACSDALVSTSDNWDGLHSTIGAIEVLQCNGENGDHDIDDTSWGKICTRDEFNKCVDEMSKAEWIKPKAEAKPIYLQAMADNGELPGVGMEVRYTPIENDSNTTLEAGQYVYGKIIAYHDGFVWTSDNGLRKLSNTKFKPALPPIELINNEPYEFDYHANGSGMQGAVMRYSKAGDHFFFDNTIFKREFCTNIKHLK